MDFVWNEVKKKWDKFHPISDSSWERIPEISQIISLKENAYLEKHSSYEVFVLKGVIRTFTSSNGKEYTSNFYMENDFLIPAFARKAYTLTVEALEDCELMLIDEKSFTALRYSTDDFREMGGRVMEKELFNKTKKEVLMATMNLEALYEFFLESFPSLPNRISQKFIASYLGVDPVSLSRLRSRIMTKEI